MNDERAKDGAARCQNVDFLQPKLVSWFKSQTRDNAVDALNNAGVPCGPIYDTEDIFNDPQVQARGILMNIDDPDVGTLKFARTGPHLSAAPEIAANPAPDLGQHTREVLENILGYNSGDVEGLAKAGVVQLADGT
tara:strand:- start:1192 stop:1599 length:408 start_codon:yes stop_codon:yes gene_type:complete